MRANSEITSFTDEVLRQTIKFALGLVPPPSPSEAPQFNKYAMVAADILSSEAKVVTTFFIHEICKEAPAEGESAPQGVNGPLLESLVEGAPARPCGSDRETRMSHDDLSRTRSEEHTSELQSR